MSARSSMHDPVVNRLRATLAYIEEMALRCHQPYRDERPIPTGYQNIAAMARMALLDDDMARKAINGEWWWQYRAGAPIETADKEEM